MTMKLQKTELTEKQIKDMLDGLLVWSEYYDLPLEINLLYQLWLYRTTRMNSVSHNRTKVKEVEGIVQSFKDHLDEVLEDITEYQLDPSCEEN